MSLFSGQGPRGVFKIPSSWSPLRIGAGGFIRGLDINPDGTMVCRTDTYGAWIWAPGVAEPGPGVGVGMWRQLVTPFSMPGGDPTNALSYRQAFPSEQGVFEIKTAPSNSRIVYMLYLGHAFVSTDKGSTWSATTWTPVDASTMNANADQAQYGPKMAVDPINSNRVFFGVAGNASSNNFYKSLDGFSTFTTISSASIAIASNSNAGGYGVVFDPRVSQQSGGNSQVIYVFSYGHGLYKSSDAGVTWAIQNNTGMPTTFRRMVCDVNGDVWVTDDTGSLNNVHVYSGTTWTTISLGGVNNGNPYHGIAIDPLIANAQHVVLGDAGGNLTQTTGGKLGSWAGSNGSPNGLPAGGFPAGLVATDIPYLSTEGAGSGFFDIGDIIYDASGTLWAPEGVGVWKANPPSTFTSPSTWNWTSQSAGIEQLVSNIIISPPGGFVIAGFWDRPFFTVQNPKVYASTYQPPQFVGAPGGFSADWASATPSFIVGPQAGGILNYSSDKGLTWNTKSMPSTGSGGGSIAASTTTNFVFLENGGGNPYYTLDGGTTWNSLASYFTTNFSITAGTGWSASGAFSSNDQLVCADRVDASTFYLYNLDPTHGGIFMSTDGGQTWAKQSGIGGANQLPNPNTSGGGTPMIRSVPGKSGHLFVTNGQGFTATHPQTTNKLWFSQNHGVTWTAIANIAEPWVVGIGKQVSGGSYPTIAFLGWYNNDPGVFLSHDQGSSFIKIGDQTMYGTFDSSKWLEVDNNLDDTIYVGLVGSGIAYYGQ